MIIMLARVNYDFPNVMSILRMDLVKSFKGARNRLSLHKLRASTKNGDNLHGVLTQ